jgi:UDP-N-acetylglucosamine 1-carboxyvinyltransferase
VKIFEINESFGLKGSVKIQGAKNSILKLMAATLLCPGEHRFANCPDITDVFDMLKILVDMGAEGKFRKEEKILELNIPEKISFNFNSKLIEKMRASITLLGPLLSQGSNFALPLPGGDNFGNRPIDFHIRCLNDLKANIVVSSNKIISEKNISRLVGSRTVLEYPSHTATDNLIMASVLAEGKTVIENAAHEPEIVDLCNFLNSLGADISGFGTSRVIINGVDKLKPSNQIHQVIGDRVEAVTYLCALGVCGGKIILENIDPTFIDTVIYKLKTVGLDINSTGTGLVASMGHRPKAADISTLPFPGIATDYKPMLVALMAVADGTSIVTENIFVGRFKYVEELLKMNADISVEGHHVVVRGKDRLKGADVTAHDIRAGASLLIAGMKASPTTQVFGVDHINRGYEDICGKMKSIGVDIAYKEI